jgi:hypothetical protein
LLQAKRETHECDVASAFLFCFSFASLQVKLLIRLREMIQPVTKEEVFYYKTKEAIKKREDYI